MIKTCINCRADYFNRWRNEPGGNLCPGCRVGVVLCAACGVIMIPPTDAAQLTLWPLLFISTNRHYANRPQLQ
jgi:hypothetical protein